MSEWLHHSQHLLENNNEDSVCKTSDLLCLVLKNKLILRMIKLGLLLLIKGNLVQFLFFTV